MIQTGEEQSKYFPRWFYIFYWYLSLSTCKYRVFMIL